MSAPVQPADQCDAASKEIEPSLGVRLLADCRAVLAGEDKVFTSTLLRQLHDLEESPWGDLKGKPLDDRALARRLREYGIKSKLVRIGERTLRGYERAAFLDAWARYLPSATDGSVTSVASVTPSPEPADVTAVTDVTLLAGGKRCDDLPADMDDFR